MLIKKKIFTAGHPAVYFQLLTEHTFLLRGENMSDRELLIKEFDEQIASGTLRIRMSKKMRPEDLSDEDKIKIMKIIKSTGLSEDE